MPFLSDSSLDKSRRKGSPSIPQVQVFPLEVQNAAAAKQRPFPAPRCAALWSVSSHTERRLGRPPGLPLARNPAVLVLYGGPRGSLMDGRYRYMSREGDKRRPGGKSGCGYRAGSAVLVLVWRMRRVATGVDMTPRSGANQEPDRCVSCSANGVAGCVAVGGRGSRWATQRAAWSRSLPATGGRGIHSIRLPYLT